MIFNVPGHIDMIRNGLLKYPILFTPRWYVKTQTRRVNRGIYQVGRDYAVQRKRGVEAEADIRIVMDEIWEEWFIHGGNLPYPILPRYAQAEGGYTREEFEKVFQALNPKWNGKKRWAFKFHAIEVQK